MPQLIPCVECSKRIRVPDDMIGKRIKCPNCGATFTAHPDEAEAVTAASAAPASVSVLEFDEEPPPRSRSGVVETPRDAETWNPVLTGVNLQLIAHFLFVAGSLLMALTLFIMLVRDEPKKAGEFFDRFLSNCLIVANVLLVVNWLLSLAASGCFLAAPFKHGARGWAVACLALTVLVLLEQFHSVRLLSLGLFGQGGQVFGFSSLAPMQRGGVVALGIGYMYNSLPEMVRLMALPFFLRAVGRNTNDTGLANFGLYAAFAAPVLFGLSFALDLLLNLISEETKTPKARKDEEQSLALIMLFLHMMALMLVLLANILVLFRARTTLQKAARA